MAYFTEGRPVEGKSAHRFEWMGATWSFASAENRAAFEVDPEKVRPPLRRLLRLGGESGLYRLHRSGAWRIVEGALYLNYSLAVRERWAKDLPGNIARAEVNWPRLLGE